MKKIFYLLGAFTSFTINAQVTTNGSGNAVIFDGVDDAMNAAQQTTVYNNFTVEAWVNPTADITVWPQEAWSTVGSPYYGGANRYFIFPPFGGYFGDMYTLASAGLTVGRNGICVFEHSHYYMPPILSWAGALNGWNHIAIVYKNRQPLLYVNGTLVATGLVSQREKVFIGNSQFGGGDYGHYQGSADEIRIWNISLDQSQLKERMCKRILTSDQLYPNLITYYNLDEAGGDTVMDHSPVNNTAILYHGASRILSGAPANCAMLHCTPQAASGSKGFISNAFACYGFNNTTCYTGYGDYSSQKVISAPGKLLGFSITPGYISSDHPGLYVTAYIDWNGDGDFNDAGEFVFAPRYPVNIKTKFYVRVPAGTTTGNKRLRIIVRADRHSGPCDNFSFGEAEDYTIMIAAARPGILDAVDMDAPAVADGFTVYPNPASNYIIAERSGFNETIAQNAPAILSIADEHGRLLMQQTLNRLVQQVDVHSLPAGIYVVTVNSGKQFFVHKIVISK